LVQYKHFVKMVLLTMAPSGPWETWIWLTFNLQYTKKFSVNLNFSVSVVPEKIFKWHYHIFTFFVIISPLKRTWPLIWTNFMQEWFVSNLIEISLLSVVEKIFSNMKTCKNRFPFCDLIRPPGTMIWPNLNQHYVRKFSCKFELFLFCGSW
jgi:hypothetical protein